MIVWLGKMAWRDSRSHRRKLLLFTSSISIGIGALVGLGSLSSTLQEAMDQQAAALLGADMALTSRQPFTPAAEALIDSLGGVQARQVSFNSMIYLPKSEGTRLAQIRALAGPFPFYGELKTAPASAAQSFRTQPHALVDEALMLQFGAAVGDSIKIGDTVFLIGGRLLRVPGENTLFSDIQPRVYIPMSYLDRTHLIQRGSRVTYTAFFRFAERDVQALAESIRSHTRGDRLRLETVERRKARLGRTLNNLYRFLNLGSFIALLLGGVGVASAIHTYTRQKLSTVAVLRSLGATARQTVLIYLIQAGGMGLVGSLAGALLGVGVLYLLPSVLADVLPIQVEPRFDLLAVLEGLVLGVGLSLLFAARPLLAIRGTSPLLTLRASFENTQPADSGLLRWSLYLGIVLTTVLFAYRLTDRWPLALGFVGGVGIAFALLTLTARAIIYGTRRFFPASWSYIWRQGLANLYRPNNQTTLLMLGLGLGTFLLSTLFLTQTNLLSYIKSVGSDQNPNVVLFDIQTDQRQELSSLVAGMDLPLLQQMPIVTMHIHSVKGQPARSTLRDTTAGRRRRGNWALRREYRATYRDFLTETEEIVAGTWRSQPTGDTLYVSLETGVASSLGVGVGDSLTFDVQGVPIEVVVGSLRSVNWQRIMPNFLAVFSPGILEPAPQSHVLVTRAATTEQMAALQRATVQPVPQCLGHRSRQHPQHGQYHPRQGLAGGALYGLFQRLCGSDRARRRDCQQPLPTHRRKRLAQDLGGQSPPSGSDHGARIPVFGSLCVSNRGDPVAGGRLGLEPLSLRDQLRAQLPAPDPRLCGGQSANGRCRHDFQPRRPHQPTARSPALARLAAQLLQHRSQRRPHGFGDDLVAFDVRVIAVGQVQRGLIAHAF